MCGELRVPPVTEELAVTVANNLRSDNEGRLPSTVAACALTMGARRRDAPSVRSRRGSLTAPQ